MHINEEERLKDRRFYLNVFVGGISLYSFTQMCKYQFQVFMKKRAIIKAEKSKVYSPDDLLQKIQKRTHDLQNLSKLKGFSYSNDNKTEIKGRIFLNGVIKCDNSFQPSNTFFGDFYMKGLIYSIKYDEEKYSLDQADESKKEYKIGDFPENTVIKKVKQFQIQEQNGITTCDIPFTDELDVTRALQLIGQRDKLITASLGQRFVGLIILLVKLLVDILCGSRSPISRSIRGVRLGITEKEIGIKVDTLTYVYGEVFFNLETGKLRFKLPDALVNDKIQYIFKLKQSLYDSHFLRNFFGIIFSCTVAYFGRRLFNYWRNNNKQNYQKITKQPL